MKFFAVFATVLTLATAAPGWTTSQISEAIDNPNTYTEFVPVLKNALNAVMDALFAGENKETVTITTKAGVAGSLTLAQLDAALTTNSVSSVFKPYVEEALDEMMNALHSGQHMDTAAVALPALQISYWSLQELDAALTSSATNPALIPYLEEALNHIMKNVFNGGSSFSSLVVVPVDVVAPVSPAAVGPISPGPAIPPPELTLPELTPQASSPLVQIILNVDKSDAVGIVDAGSVIERPTPEQSIIRPTPEQAVIRPTPEQAVIRPTPEQDVIRPTPEQVVIRPTPDQILVNPIDSLAPLPVESEKPSAGAAIGPMV